MAIDSGIDVQDASGQAQWAQWSHNICAFNFKCSLFHEIKHTSNGTIYVIYVLYYKWYGPGILYSYIFIDTFTYSSGLYI